MLITSWLSHSFGPVSSYRDLDWRAHPLNDLDSRIARCISDAVREVNSLRAVDEQVGQEPATVLLGDGGALDSLGFVNLAVALEDSIQREFGPSVVVVGELLGAPDPASFRTIELLHSFVRERIDAQDE